MSDFIDGLSEDALRKMCAFFLKASKSHRLDDATFRAVVLSTLSPPSEEMISAMVAAIKRNPTDSEMTGRRILAMDSPSISDLLDE